MTVRVGIVGMGKMGVSHFAIANAHAAAEVVAVCDSARYLLDMVQKYTGVRPYTRLEDMLKRSQLDAVIIATPTPLHAGMVELALQSGVHVFCEKPFCLDVNRGQRLSSIAAAKGLVNQVGYHNRFVGAFREAKRLVDAQAIGRVTHVLAEAYGPVVLRRRGLTWRTNQNSGGGCLYDYAAHPINLLNWIFGCPSKVTGSVLDRLFSSDTEDAVYSTLLFPSGACAQLAVNWSDESYRKMTTKLTIVGTGGRIAVDRQECSTYLRDSRAAGEGYVQGWNVRNTTELSPATDYYLRGEEYSAQIDCFIGAIRQEAPPAIDASFASAVETDQVMAMIVEDANSGAAGAPRRQGGKG